MCQLGRDSLAQHFSLREVSPMTPELKRTKLGTEKQMYSLRILAILRNITITFLEIECTS